MEPLSPLGQGSSPSPRQPCHPTPAHMPDVIVAERKWHATCEFCDRSGVVGMPPFPLPAWCVVPAGVRGPPGRHICQQRPSPTPVPVLAWPSPVSPLCRAPSPRHTCVFLRRVTCCASQFAFFPAVFSGPVGSQQPAASAATRGRQHDGASGESLRGANGRRWALRQQQPTCPGTGSHLDVTGAKAACDRPLGLHMCASPPHFLRSTRGGARK